MSARYRYLAMSAGRPPDWRWTHVVERAREGRLTDDDDPIVRRGVEFLRRSRPGSRLPCEDHALAIALRIYGDGGRIRDETQAWLLTFESAVTIADKLRPRIPDITPEAVETFDLYFYCVTELQEATHWLWACALDLWPGAGRPVTLGDNWRVGAFSGGPVILEVLLDHYDGNIVSNEYKRVVVANRLSLELYLAPRDSFDRASVLNVIRILTEMLKIVPKGKEHRARRERYKLEISLERGRLKGMPRPKRRRRVAKRQSAAGATSTPAVAAGTAKSSRGAAPRKVPAADVKADTVAPSTHNPLPFRAAVDALFEGSDAADAAAVGPDHKTAAQPAGSSAGKRTASDAGKHRSVRTA